MKRQRQAPYSNRPFKRPRQIQRRPSVAIRTPRADIVPERKYFTLSLAATAIATSGTTWAGGELDNATTLCLCAPTTGDDITNRDSRKIQILSIKINGTINVPAQTDVTTSDDAAQIRLLLVQDKQTNSAQLNAEDVMQGLSNNAINTFQNHSFFGRFQVWKDKTFDLANPNLSWDGTNMEQQGMTRHFKWNVKFKKPIVVHFNATNGGTVADIVDNSFHIIGLCSNNELAPTLGYAARTTFLDV